MVNSSLCGFIELSSSTFDKREPNNILSHFLLVFFKLLWKLEQRLLSTATGNSCFNLLHFETM